MPARSKTRSGELGPPSLKFEIVDETDDYLVLDKPPHLLTHPSKPTNEPTLLDELRKLLAFEIVNAGQVSIVNRLDRETSGLVLVAKNSAVARRFGLLMQQHRVRKEYLAIVWGWPEWETSAVDAPLDRLGKHGTSAIWLKQGIHEKGARARTEFFVERRFLRKAVARNSVEPTNSTAPQSLAPPNLFANGRFALLRAVPHTGRTHQIRVHLSSLGHPVVGDKIYGPNEQLYLEFINTGWTADLERHLLLPRQALHSTRLAIDGVGDWTSELPQDLAAFFGGPL